MKKRVAVPRWFGEITPEELEKIRQDSEALEARAADFQSRPKYNSKEDNHTSQEG